MAAGLSLLTWNLAMLERSSEAPRSWSMEQTELAVRERVLAAAPDVVLFQELPRLVPYIETHDMIRANPTSHQGNLATLVRRQLLTGKTAGDGGPTVTVVEGCALLATFSSGLTVANVHLAPGPGAIGTRLEQMARIVEASPTPHLLVVGDTNTRVHEGEAFAQAGLRGTRPPAPTWDGRNNRFHADTPVFSAYFTRWFATEGVKVSGVTVWSEAIESDGHRFHLSDHHALGLRAALR